MMRQYHRIKQEHPDKLLFFRLGDFYEMFYQDAVVGSRELEITLTSRNRDPTGTPIPMCGVPHHSITNYLARLIKKGHKVAICEQVESPAVAKGIVRREVARVVTPGTVLEDGVLDSRRNNFIASLLAVEDRVGASFLDLSTGQFLLTEFSGEQAWAEMQQEFRHFRPREVILPEGSNEEYEVQISLDSGSPVTQTSEPDWCFRFDYSQGLLLEHFRVATLEGFGLNGQVAAIAAAGALLHYVQQTQKSSALHITELSFWEPANYLQLDDYSVENLELLKGLDGNRKWTLLATLDVTKTPMGARLLRNWMLRPSLDIGEIEERLDAVEELQASIRALDQLSVVLKGIQDLERLLGRITLRTANARDLLALRNSLQQLPELRRHLADYASKLLCSELDELTDVAHELAQALTDDPPVTLNEGGIIRPGYDEELDELRAVAHSGKAFLARLEAEERESTGISSLKVKYNKVFGYFMEVTKTHLKSVPEHYTRKQTLVGCERFVTAELKEHEEKVLTAQERIVTLEKELFCRVRDQASEHGRRIQSAARQVAQVDCLMALAQTARKYHYVRPQLDNSRRLYIRAGRHPVVEQHSSEPFIPNDLDCDTDVDQLLILTGPNMGGKSTYLRQNALIVILAQMGSFVPAEEARVGLVDRVFTRVGASDDLARGRSTFLVEMIETANILHMATCRSLVLLDEVGRGTATFDGLSIAWSVAEYLLREPKRQARTLFATHYQELTQLEQLHPAAKNYCVTVHESGSDILFSHRVAPGVASRSYGIEVARLAGLPATVVERARHILQRLEQTELDLSGRSRIMVKAAAAEEWQKTLF